MMKNNVYLAQFNIVDFAMVPIQIYVLLVLLHFN